MFSVDAKSFALVDVSHTTGVLAPGETLVMQAKRKEKGVKGTMNILYALMDKAPNESMKLEDYVRGLIDELSAAGPVGVLSLPIQETQHLIAPHHRKKLS